jgi:hypothetical protein
MGEVVEVSCRFRDEWVIMLVLFGRSPLLYWVRVFVWRGWERENLIIFEVCEYVLK